MVDILEKTEYNTDFHQIVDFIEASHIRVKTTDGETKILAKVNGRQRTVFELSIRRHLKLNDEEGDVRYEEVFPTVSRLNAGHDRENIAKTSAMPHEASPRVTSLGGGEGILEITQLKIRVKTLKDNEKKRKGLAQEDAPNTRGMDQGEDLLVGDTVKDSDKNADKGSDSTDEMANVLGTLGAANILASGGLSKKDKEKGKMTEPEQPSKEKVLEQISVQLARDLEAKFAQEDQTIREQAERDYDIARIHAERELEMMIAELDKSNKLVAKYLSENKQSEAGLSHDEKVELIDELLMSQRNLAQIKKYQAQQNKPATKTKRRNFYMSILRSNAG
nr:hypothetical protein [Tanacetum cinerariifolium]